MMDEKLPNRTEALALLVSMTPEESQQWARRTAEWVIALGRQADGTLEDALIVRNRESGFLAAVPVAEVDRVAAGLPFQVAGAMRDAAARIHTEGSE